MKIQEITTGAEYQPLKKYKRKKKKRILSFFKFLLFLVILTAILVGVGLSPLFSVNRIEVYGNKHYNSSEVIEASGLIVGNNWFRSNSVNLKGIITFRSIDAEKLLLQRCPYLKSAIVRIDFMGVVRIEVTEREPVALVPYMGSNLVIDSESFVLALSSNAEEEKLPVIKGIDCSGYSLGQPLAVHDPKYMDAFRRVMEVITSADVNAGERGREFGIKDIISYIDVSDLDNINLYLDSRLTVNLGNYREISEYRINFLREIFYFQLTKEDKGLLDFTSGDYPSFIPD
ncbi:cell division protein FtsQ/DivIB [Acetivibrio straminisolvens]|uniref:Cell division protein FtsQ n=1 Tax=Acetivibrio straminisolvens JCM 21531 TaxID=1294263 RepID=W4VDD6_9FIRM|nr:FtsQ-type POTRA domain-containing protein [Acetivibrio straminisolvens]GAE90769.1 cell division protein FtsQ [Acetivibrio straminisolvens JCM 21531]